MKDWDKDYLHVSENGRYLMEGKKPFFWLGDTAWLMLQKLDEEDIRMYLRNRKEKGYNVIQTVLVHILPGPNAQGNFPPGIKDVTKEPYWSFVDRILKLAEEMELYIGLLPAWGSLVKSSILNMDNIDDYASFLGKRFQERKNLIWILGGDVRGDIKPEVFRREARILKSFNPERLIAFHPFGRTSSSLWFQEEDWLDINMFQSGHRRYDQEQLGEWDDNNAAESFFGEDNWRYVLRDHSFRQPRPTLDGEPSYEGVPQGLHNPRNPYWEEWDVRRYAYWSVFAGAAGHTYGSNAVMQFYNNTRLPGAYGVREVWKDAVHHPGSSQLKYLKELMESVDFRNGRPDDSLLSSGQRERHHRIAVFAGEDYVFCYDYSGDEFELNLTRYREIPMDAWWMNPQDGTYSYITTLRDADRWMASPVRRKGTANDWVLVLKKAACNRNPFFVNGELDEYVMWYDTDGNIINASDGGMIYADGVYHWYGQALRPLPVKKNGEGGQTTTQGVVMYASTDLHHWKYEGTILPCSLDPESELFGPMRFERPKIIYNKTTKQYVLWCHYVKYPGDHGNASGTGEAGVAVCDTVNGVYRWLGHSRPIDEAGMVRDCTVWQDSDGSAYFIYDRQVGKDRCLHIVQLSEDYLSFTPRYRRIEEAYRREAAAVVYHDGYYFLITSGLTGWDFNQARYFRAKDLFGPWEDMGDPCVEDWDHQTFHSQSTWIFKVEAKEDLYIHMAERHNTQNFERCSYIWLPIEFQKDHTLSLTYRKEWSLREGGSVHETCLFDTAGKK